VVPVQAREFEKLGDRAEAQLAKTRDTARAIGLADRALDDYKKAIAIDSADEKLVHKYVKIIEIKYNLLIPDNEMEEEKKKVYSETLSMLERLYPGQNNSIYADFDISLLLILNNINYNIVQAIVVANRIRDLCEKIYNEDRTFEDYSALAALGRLNYLAPNIPFILGWPDKAKSKQYLEEALKAEPDSLLIKYFLAETLYALNEKERAEEYFREVVSAAPRDDYDYFQDKKTQLNCGIRMKELGLQ
jgi:tetratricopeptide (TPR) repeat protein